MSGDQGETGGSTAVDHAAAFAEIRQRLSSLGDSIDALRVEADRLNDKAAGRVTLAVLEPPATPQPDNIPAFDEMAALTDSIEAMGRHAADVPEDFDPRPYDPEADDLDDAPLDAGRHGLDASGAEEPAPAGAFDDLAAAPAYEPEQVGIDASLPAFDAGDGPSTFDEREPDAVLSADHPAASADAPAGDAHEGAGATVLEFTPRSLSDPAAEVPAFGHLTEEAAAPAEASADASVHELGTESPAESDDVEQAPEEQSAFGPLPGVEPRKPKSRSNRSRWASREDDGLDAIAETESTAVPQDWDEADVDDDAFDKFFSSEVEPEPAQRWLLNE